MSLILEYTSNAFRQTHIEPTLHENISFWSFFFLNKYPN